MILTKRTQNASAIIVAIAIVSTVALIAVSLMVDNQHQIAITQSLKLAVQSKQYQKQLLDKAVKQLQQDAKDNGDQQIVDTLPILMELKNVKPGYQAKAYIVDAQAYLNINDLTDTSWQKSFNNLQKLLIPSMDEDDAKVATQQIVSILKTSDDITVRYFLLPSQLLQQKIFTLKDFAKIEPAIIALPVNTPINVNDVSAEVLASLGEGMSLDEAKKIVKQHEQYKTVQDFMQNGAAQAANIPQGQLDVNSRYFIVKGLITYAGHKSMFKALLYRPTTSANSDGTIDVDILWIQGG